MKNITFVLLLLLSCDLLANTRTNWATPTQIDIIPGGGFVMNGDFGNSNNCVVPNKVHVYKEHPQYEKMYSLALLAFTSGYQVSAYIHNCEPIPWLAVNTTTYSTLSSGGELRIEKQ